MGFGRWAAGLRWNPWTVVVWAIAGVIATPVLFIGASVFQDSGAVWAHLVSTVLGRYVVNSASLMVGVAIGVVAIGVSCAWLVTMCEFPGRRLFEVGLLFPLAAPSYLLAYSYTELLEYYGPVQRWLRQLFHWTSVQDYWFPPIRSLGGAIAMLTLVLYPYVYLLTRVAFLEQSVTTLEASRALGCRPWQGFFKVALPLARPAIVAGLALALMETLNDFGTVQFFGVETFTTGIYRTWFGLGERVAAGQLAAVLMVFILVLILLERWSRSQARYYQTSNNYQTPRRYGLGFWGAGGAIALCGFPVVLGFLVPVGLLVQLVWKFPEKTLQQSFWEAAHHSLILALVTALLGGILALVLAYGQRLYPNFITRGGVRIAAMGYAIPGSVIAVGVLVPMGRLDNWLNHWFKTLLHWDVGLLLSGTIVALTFAYVVRFLAVSFSAIESSLGKITPSLDEASRSLGLKPLEILWKVHTPLMWSGLLTAVMLVFVDVMKELPATIIIRPFNFDTLAVKVYQYAADERLVEASAPALTILLVGMLPVFLLSWQVSRTRPGQ